ncbi:MAG: stage II sporulation protein M [Lachnospiraceae bacterium]|jgi:uncharacterized membrane protein SpoIIM required for sporulation|nr:stage II sporulation protein M [Lachnospiraceae bacterium]
MRIHFRTQSGRIPFLFLFLIGLVLGILVMNIGKSLFLEKTGLFDEASLYQMKYMTVDGNTLFVYVLWERLKLIAFLILLASTYLGIFIISASALWVGITTGMFLSALVIRYGMKGILFALVGIFPQYLLYIPAFIALFLWSEQLYRSLHATATVTTSESGRKVLFQKLLMLLMIIGAVVIGCLLESYVNPYLMSRLLKVF